MPNWTELGGVMTEYTSAATIDSRVAFYRKFGARQGQWYQWLFEQLPLTPGMRVLDVGCGGGDLWTTNAHRVPARVELTLGDLSPGIVQAARGRLQGLPFFANSRELDACNLPFPNSYYDLVICAHAMYHFPKRHLAVREFKRVLRPGGHVVATTVGVGHMKELNQTLHEFTPELSGTHFGPPDYHGNDLWNDLAVDFSSLRAMSWSEKLVVTDPRALVDFLLATHLREQVAPHLSKLLSHLNGIVARQGSIDINTAADTVLAS